MKEIVKHQSNLLSLKELVNPEEIEERKRMLEIQKAKLDKAEERFLDKAKRMFEMDVEMAESNWI